jgi:hypothetical protein
MAMEFRLMTVKATRISIFIVKMEPNIVCATISLHRLILVAGRPASRWREH